MVTIKMGPHGVVGEDGEHWAPRSTQQASPGFAAYLQSVGRATVVEGDVPTKKETVQTRKAK